MVAYEKEFLKLERYGLDIVNNQERRCKRFEDGLADDVRMMIVVHKIRNFADLVDAAKAIEKIQKDKKQEQEQEKRSLDQRGGSQMQSRSEPAHKRPRWGSEQSRAQSRSQSGQQFQSYQQQ